MLITFLDGLKDHRRSQGQRYELRFIVLFSIMAILSNAKSYRDISRFIKKHFEKLQKDFGCSQAKPNHLLNHNREVQKSLLPGVYNKA